MTWLGALFRRLHVHYWESSAWSGRGAFTIDETCSCGARHHQTDAYAYCRGEWIDGPHPWAESERTKGNP